MFEWKAEEMKLNKMSRIGNSYSIEYDLSREEKIAILDKYSDGAFSYFLNLNEKYMSDFCNGIIKKSSSGYVLENSKKAWIRRNDVALVFWNGKSKDNFWTKEYLRLPFFSYYNDLYFGYVVTSEKINERFHDLLADLEKKEIAYFKEHDEYEIKLKELRNCGFEACFNNRIAFYSDGYVYVRGNDDDERKITLEEINILLDSWGKLKAYQKELEKVTKITF